MRLGARLPAGSNAFDRALLGWPSGSALRTSQSVFHTLRIVWHRILRSIWSMLGVTQDDRCPPQPSVGRQLVDNEPSDIGASYLAAVDACEVDDGPDAALSWVIGEHAGPADDPIE